MDIFLKATAGSLIAVLAVLVLGKQNKDFSVMLIILVCCMLFAAAYTYLTPVLDFLKKLESLANLDGNLFGTLFKTAGICLVTEIAVLICGDSGSSSIGKGLQILAAAVILWLSIPILEELLGLLQNILGEQS